MPSTVSCHSSEERLEDVRVVCKVVGQVSVQRLALGVVLHHALQCLLVGLILEMQTDANEVEEKVSMVPSTRVERRDKKLTARAKKQVRFQLL